MWTSALARLLPAVRLVPLSALRVCPRVLAPSSLRPFSRSPVLLKSKKKAPVPDYSADELYQDELPTPASSSAVDSTDLQPLDVSLDPSTQLAAEREASSPTLPTSTKKLNKLLSSHKPYELKESDLIESFIRGSGPGGQVINKSSISVSLVHKPTGLRVVCQYTRSQEQNRKIARKIMADKLATVDTTRLSRSEILAAKAQLKKRRLEKKSRRKYQAAAQNESNAELDRIGRVVDETWEGGDLSLEAREGSLNTGDEIVLSSERLNAEEVVGPSSDR